MADPIIDEIKARVELAGLISQRVQLKKAGRYLKGLCPFHGEKTPSFVVYPEQGRYHCFGCGKSGDAFTWLQDTEHLDFGEVLHLLADRAGVALPERRERVPEVAAPAASEALAEAAVFYHEQLLRAPAAEPARHYLLRRGLNAETVRRFGLGWAPDSWDALGKHLRERGIAEEHLLEAGLVREGERGHYDYFRGRVMFPIRDAKGRVRGFGGRVLGDGQPKYLNSPQTPLFDKSATLYGLDLAAPAIRKEGLAVIVEGYMDVVGPHQAGFENVVASLGTALTDRQLELLRRYTSTIVLALDADAAGQAATLRGLEVARAALREQRRPVPGRATRTGYLQTSSVQLKIAVLKGGKDPDEIVREDPAAWRQMVADAVPMMDHKLNVELAQVDLNDPRAKAAAIQEIARFLVLIPDPIEWSHYVDRLAQRLRAPLRDVQAEVQRAARQLRQDEARQERARRTHAAGSQATTPGAAGAAPPDEESSATQAEAGSQRNAKPAPTASGGTDDVAEEHLLMLLVQAPHLLRKLPRRLEPDEFHRPERREIYRALLARHDSQPGAAGGNGPAWPQPAWPQPAWPQAPGQQHGGSLGGTLGPVEESLEGPVRTYYDRLLVRARRRPPENDSQLAADLASVARRVRERNLRQQLVEAQYLLAEAQSDDERLALARQVERLASQLGRVQVEQSRASLYTASAV